MKIYTILFGVVISTFVFHTSLSSSSTSMNEVDVKEEDDVLLWQEEEDHESWWAQQDDDAMEEGDAWMLESAEEFMAMLSKEEQDDHRALQYASSYKTPRWWGRYKRMIGRPYLRRCKKWVEDQDHPPTSGSCPRRHGNYTCFFGNQACLENGKKKPFPHPNQQCTCVDRVWECQPWECPTPQFYKCPLKSPLDSPQYPQGSMRCLGDMECTYGEETCCGKTHPSLVCKCANGSFKCRNTDACFRPMGMCEGSPPKVPEIPVAVRPGPEVPGEPRPELPVPPEVVAPPPEPLLASCPLDSPLETQVFPGCSSDLTCHYGEEECCDGSKGPEVTCTCEANSDPIVCFFSDRCLGFRCPPENPEPLPPDFIPLPQIPPRLHGQVCSDPTAVRMLGTDCRCCGECVPEWRCQCDGNFYQCIQNLPFGLPCECPPEDPTEEEPPFVPLTVPGGDHHPEMHGTDCPDEGSITDVGEDCSCCDTCVPDWRCSCKAGKHDCYKTNRPGRACSCGNSN